MPADLSGGEAGWSSFNVFAKYWDEESRNAQANVQTDRRRFVGDGRLGAHSPFVADRARRCPAATALAGHLASQEQRQVMASHAPSTPATPHRSRLPIGGY